MRHRLRPALANSIRQRAGSIVTYDADASTLFAAMSSQPNSTRKALINTTILALKAAGIWTLLDECWFLAAHDAQAARLGWKRYKDLTAVASPTFTADGGYAGNGTSSYLSTTFVPSTDGVNYLQDDMSFGVYGNTDTAATVVDLGARDGASTRQAAILARLAADTASLRIHTDLSWTPANNNATGLVVARRTASNATQFYHNGLLIASDTTASVARPAYALFIGAVNTAGVASLFSTRQYAFAFVGASMTAQQQSDLFTIVQAYLTASLIVTLDIQTLSDPGNGQGVAYDGTHYYYNDSTKIYKYTRDSGTGAYTLVTSRVISGDDPVAKTQITNMNYYNGSLWCGANNFSATTQGWVIQYNPATLAHVATYVLEGDVNEGGAWRVDPIEGAEYWNVYSARNGCTRWRLAGGVSTKVADYTLPLAAAWTYSAGVSSIYDGAAWYGDYLITMAKGSDNLQDGFHINISQLHVHHWNGTNFDAVKVIPTGVVSASQGIHWETTGTPDANTVLLIAHRATQRIQRATVNITSCNTI